MTILPLVIAPDPLLKQRSAPVTVFDDGLAQFVADMFQTMYAENGIGLAAVQVGVLKRILVADVTWRSNGSDGEKHVLINPEILESSDEPLPYKEGCLSFPDQFAQVVRPAFVRVKYQDVSGKSHESAWNGLLATCVQHEIDHLNGITFVDHLTPMKRDMILRKVQKIKKSAHHHVHDEHCNHG